MIRIPTHRQPTHPGEMLLEEFLIPMGLSQRELADSIHVPYQRINELANGRQVRAGARIEVGEHPRLPADVDRQQRVLECRSPREELRRLKHHPDRRPRLHDRSAVDLDPAARCRAAARPGR